MYFSERTKSVSLFGNNFLNYEHKEKSDDLKQNIDEITRTFGYVIDYEDLLKEKF